MIDSLEKALATAKAMGWEILWPLILGFALSGVIQAVVRKDQVSALLADDSAGSLAAATALGAASSSCSYAAVALARALFRKGASLSAAMAFEIASTNLAAREQANKAVAGSMEGHASMDMSVAGDGTLWQRLFSGAGLTSVSQYFVMDVAAIWKDTSPWPPCSGTAGSASAAWSASFLPT